MKKRVVITGLGVISAPGVGVEPLWQMAAEGKSSIKPIESFDCGDFPGSTVAEIKDFNPKDYIQKSKAIKVMSRDIQLSCAASKLAFADCGISEESFDPERIGVNMGSGLIDNEVNEIAQAIKASLDEANHFDLHKFGQDGRESLFPLWMLKYLPNMPACHISIIHNLQGPSNTITTSCASSLQAIGESTRIIERGDADLMVAGGTESRTNVIGLSRYQLFGVLMKNGNRYAPMDADASGFVVGEGAGIIILEELEHALKRKARIYAEVTGYGSSCDFNYIPNKMEDYQGRKQAMSQAVKDASLSFNEVSCIHSHGSGIKKDDLLEAQAISDLFGECASEIPVTATKAVMGHTGCASGSFQTILSAKMLELGKILPTTHFKNKNSDMPLSIVSELQEAHNLNNILSNAFSITGENASLVLKRWEEC